MPSVLFVCTGNQCRSPLAAAFFRKFLERDKSLIDWMVTSAGTWTRDGLSVSPFCMDLARAHGVDLSGHHTRSITSLPIKRFNVIVVMEQGQKEALVTEFQEVRNKIFLLSTLAGRLPYDIKDPISQDAETASEIIRDMRECIEFAFARICMAALDGKDN